MGLWCFVPTLPGFASDRSLNMWLKAAPSSLTPFEEREHVHALINSYAPRRQLV